jgi:D-psicose/D-tagatose/L-ribulose 3-epimerase
MNPLGVHAAVWVGGWSPEETRHAIASSKAAGYDLIELTATDPGAVDAGLTCTLLGAAGMGATVSLGLTFGTDISSEDVTIVDTGRTTLERALGMATAVGATHLTGVLYSAMGKYDSPATDAGRRNAVAVLRDLAAQAASSDVWIGLEIVNRYESNLVNTTRQALTLIDDIGAENVMVHLDTYHMNIEEGDLARPVAEAGDRLGYVHVGESHRGYLGSGTIDFPRFFRALVAAGYEGPITFESFSSAVVDPALSNTLGVWRNLWDDGADLAAHARRFVTDGLHAARR